MNEPTKLNEITKSLELIIKSQVSKKTEDLRIYERKYEDLKFHIENTLREAEFVYENMKDEGLTTNTIESEGFLLCAKTLAHYLKDVESE